MVIMAAVAMVIGLAPSASAAYAVQPVGPAWTPNGGVHAVVVDEGANRVYVGGSFTGGVAALRADTGALLWNGNANGDVRALALGPNGSLLLGGAFTTVGGATHRKIASVNAATGAVNNGFRGTVGGTVRDIVVVGNTAYFGGAFTNHSGFTQRGLGAVDATTGTRVTTFTVATNGTVYSLATNGSRLFFGGEFTAANGQPRSYLASATLASNAVDAWAPPMACTGCNRIWDLVAHPARNRVYAAGRNAGGVYVLDMNSSTPIATQRRFNGDVQALTLAPDGRLYAGGHFVTVNGVARELVAEFDVSGTAPVLGAFSANFVTSFPGVWGMASTSSRLYVGGDFTRAGTQTKAYPYFAMFPSGSTPPPDTTAPTVTERSPLANATGVAVNADVTATFSEPVQGVATSTFTLTGGGTSVTAAVTQGSGNTWILNPGADLAASTTYTATLTGGTTAIRDLANIPLATTSWSFTTGEAPADATAPTVSATHPKNGATGISTGVSPNVLFSEPVKNVGIETFTLTRTDAPGTLIPGKVVFNTTSGRWVFNPDPTLDAGTSYTATVTTGITDMADNPLASNVSWTFTTAA
jgi:hypothetical protein